MDLLIYKLDNMAKTFHSSPPILESRARGFTSTRPIVRFMFGDLTDAPANRLPERQETITGLTAR